MTKRKLRGFQLRIFGFGYSTIAKRKTWSCKPRKTDSLRFPSFPRAPSFRPRLRMIQQKLKVTIDEVSVKIIFDISVDLRMIYMFQKNCICEQSDDMRTPVRMHWPF